jgi:hypothetical protein
VSRAAPLTIFALEWLVERTTAHRRSPETRREQEAQVGLRKALAITRSTGPRRRERRFESCRGHQLRPAIITVRDDLRVCFVRFRGMNAERTHPTDHTTLSAHDHGLTPGVSAVYSGPTSRQVMRRHPRVGRPRHKVFGAESHRFSEAVLRDDSGVLQ